MIYLASIWVIPVVIAITFHEAAHGFVARFLGDETAWKLGRVSLISIVSRVIASSTDAIIGAILRIHWQHMTACSRYRIDSAIARGTYGGTVRVVLQKSRPVTDF